MITFFLILTIVFTCLSMISRVLLNTAVFTGKILVKILKILAKSLVWLIIIAVILLIVILI